MVYNTRMDKEQELRIDLAAALRWCAKLDMHEGVANHFSVALDDGRFLINPADRHFSDIRAGDLLCLDANAPPPPQVDATAWCLHGYFHRHLPRARCLMHAHPCYATTLALLKDWRMMPTDQNTCRFFGRVAYDDDFGGMLLAEDEARRQCEVIGDKPVLFMRGHGVLTRADDVATAFDLLYYFERSCRHQYLAMASGRELFAVDEATAEKTARQWDAYQTRHFDELKRLLYDEDPTFQN